MKFCSNMKNRGGVPRSQVCMDKFRGALAECGLADLGYSGDTFTWRNHCHDAEGYIRERLDRAVANMEWRTRLPTFEVINGEPRHSDHRAVIVNLEGADAEIPCMRGPSTFKFEASWLKEDGCTNLVQEAWLRSFQEGATIVNEGLKDVSKVMSDWSRNILGDLEKRIHKLKRELAKCIKGPISRDSIHQEQVLKYRLEKLEEQKDIYWKQRAHVHWLQEGDRNTSLFHACATQRKKRNKIKRLKMEEGIWIEERDLCTYISSQYRALFQSQGVNRLEELISTVECKVSLAMNELLLTEYTEEEVTTALNGIGDLKAPGPDGMPAIFFQKILGTYW
jgi:hypothetical protein